MKKNHIKVNIKFLRSLSGLSQEKFGTLFNVTRDNIASYERGSTPNLDFITDIVNYFHISYDDIILYELTEEIFKTKYAENVINLNDDKIDDKIDDKRKVQKMSSKEPPKIPGNIFSLRTDRLVERQSIPIYDMDAVAGLVPLFAGDYNQRVIDVMETTLMPKCDGGLHIVGDSMYPLIKSGDIVFYKQIKDVVNSILWGEMYLISFDIDGEEYVTVKYVQKSEIKDHVKLVSYNEHHGPKDIHIGNIRALAFIKASLRLNSIK